MRIGFLILVLTMLATPAAAERAPAWTAHRSLADGLSYGLVGLELAGETIDHWRQPDRGVALRCEALRVGLTIGIVEGVKRLVHRTRPDGSDDRSFYSEHAALAFVSTGWSVQASVPIAIGAGYLRVAAGKHYPSDIGIGAGAGLLARRVC